MKKIKYLSILFSVALLFSLKWGFNVEANLTNIQAPYYTYTVNSDNQFIRTSEAYIPTTRILKAGEENFGKIQHIFIDKETDYLYVADNINRAVFVFDENFNYINKLTHDKLSFAKAVFVTEDSIYVLNKRSTTILQFDKELFLTSGTVELVNEIGKPESPIFDTTEGKAGYPYNPDNFVVDARGNIYVQARDSENGLMMLDPEGRFMTFFGGNPYRIPIVDQIRGLFLTEKQEKKLEKINPDNVTNLAIDEKGFIYTVTSTLANQPVKKFNVKGVNFFRDNVKGITRMESVTVGQYNNVFTLTAQGVIFEYDTNGNLLFMFGGAATNSNRVGIMTSPVSIAVNSRDQIIVADNDSNSQSIQVFNPTLFADSVHDAINTYQKGNYDESLEKWEYVVQYNSLFDYARIGIADAHMRENNYQDAFDEYRLGKDFNGLSEAKWGIRQDWLNNNLGMILTVVLILALLRVIYYFLNKKYNYSVKIRKGLKDLRSKSKTYDELLFIFDFLKRPFDGFYKIKREKRVSIRTSTIIYILMAALYIMRFQFTNELFVRKDNVNVLYELFVIAFVLVLWVISNYLVCIINDGEGSFKNVYNATAYALSPFLVIMPFIILISNVITYQERVFYDLGYTIILVWIIFLMFFKIKDIHNYEVGETLVIVFKSVFTMLIIALSLFILNLLGTQLVRIIIEIATEVIK